MTPCFVLELATTLTGYIYVDILLKRKQQDQGIGTN